MCKYCLNKYNYECLYLRNLDKPICKFTWDLPLIGNAYLVNNNTISNIGKPSGSEWSNGGYSLNGFSNNAYLSFTPNSNDKYFVMGLSTIKTTPLNQYSTQYYFFLDQFGQIFIYNYSHAIYNSGPGVYKKGDNFEIIFNRPNIDFVYKGTTLVTLFDNTTSNFYLSAVLGNRTDVQINNIKFCRFKI